MQMGDQATRKMIALKLLYFSLLLSEVNTLRNLTSNLVEELLKESKAKFCFFLVCWNNYDKIYIQKLLQSSIKMRMTFLPVHAGIISQIDDHKYEKINYVMDLSCEKSQEILLEISQNGKFRYIYNWLMIGESRIVEKNIKTLFDGVELRADMEVKITVPISDNSQYDIYRVYKPGLGVDVVIEKVSSFTNGKLNYIGKTNFYESRKNLSGVLLRSANTVNYLFNTSIDYEKELRTREQGTFEKYNIQLFLILKQMHRFDYNTTLRNAWFGNSSSGIDSGISQLLHENKVDISSAGGLLRYGRMPYYDYLVPFFKFRACFFFRNPGTINPGTEVLKPFSVKTWYATIGAAIAIALAIKFAYWVEYRFLTSNVNYSMFTSVVITISIFAQQGSALFPRHLGGRIIYLNLLLFSIIIYNYYTSSLVSSLLSSKPSVLTTIKELYESSLKVGVEDQPYTTTYILQQKKDYYIQKLNSTKICETGKPNYLSPDEGIMRVKYGGFAYHTQTTTAYALIARTFEQDLICDLAEIDFVAPGVLGLMTPKKSAYTELFSISLSKMRQSGIFKREYDVWVAKKPGCLLSSRIVSVERNELFLVYMILFLGILLATLILIIEIIWARLQKNQ